MNLFSKKDGISRIEFLLVCCSPLCLFLWPIWSGENALLSFFHDDFYYYLKIAHHIATGSGSTFDGVHDTNGYHPLWLVFLVFGSLIAEWTTVDQLIIAGLLTGLVALGGSLILFGYVRSRSQSLPFSFSYAFIGVFIYLIYCVRGGMEVALAVPLLVLTLMAFCSSPPKPWLFFTLVTLCSFARLDSLAVLAPMVAFYLIDQNDLKSKLLALAIPISAIGSYCLFNLIFFDSVFPISGLAKSASRFSGFHAATWTYFVAEPAALALTIFSVLLGLFLLPSTPSSDHQYRFSAILAGIGAVVFFMQNSLRSDWPLWTWYLYPMVFFIIAALPVAAIRFERLLFLIKINDFNFSPEIINYSLFVFLSFLLVIIPPPCDGVTEAAMKIRAHEQKTGGGIYAMGDRAGMVGYLLHSPLLQLEGLTMDRNYLTDLRQTEFMEKLLNRYKVDYYLVSTNKTGAINCRKIRELTQSSQRALPVFADRCWPMDEEFTVQDHGRPVQTLIFRRP